jgi:hypothetical protein
MRTLSRALVVTVVFACVWLLASRDARACGHGNSYGMDGLAALAIVGGAAAVTVGVTNTTFTFYDAMHATPDNAPSTKWSSVERYVATPQVVIGALVGIGVMKDDPKALPTVVAWSAWPAALMVHGFYAHQAQPYGEGWKTPVIVMGVVDGGLAVYDVGLMVTGERPSTVHSIGELVGALPQTLFGLAYVAQSSGTDVRTGLLLTALPAALTTHAIVELLLPDVPPPEPSKEQGKAGPVRSLLPTFMVQGTQGPAPGLGLTGAF